MRSVGLVLSRVPAACWALAFGVLALAGFAPVNLWWLGLVGYGGLFYLWQGDGLTARRAALLGLLFGLAHFGFGVSWVHISIHRFGGAPLPLAVVLAALLVLYCALFIAASGWLLRRLASAHYWWLPATVFMLGDWLRGRLFTGFPWLSPGYGLVESPFESLAAWVGVYGMGLVALLLTSLAVAVFDARRRSSRVTMPLVALVLLLSLPLLAKTFTTAAGKPLEVAVLQGSVTQDKKWLPEQFQPTLRLYRDLSLKHADADLVVWPEVAIPGWYSDVAASYLQPLASELGAELVVGTLRQATDSARYYNAAIQVAKAASPAIEYHKRHLVPFGEYAPFGSWLGEFIRQQLGIPMPDFQVGARQQPPMRVLGQPFVITLCYENAFGHEFRRQIAAGRFIINMSNDGWFGASIALRQHLQMARLRALESQRWLLRATNTGVTAAINPQGMVVSQIPILNTGSLQQAIQPRRGQTYYLTHGDTLFLVGLLALLGVGLLLQWLQRRG